MVFIPSFGDTDSMQLHYHMPVSP